MRDNIEILIRVFIENAIIQGKCTESGDYRKANKAHDKIMKAIKKIKVFDPGFKQLIPLLQHEDDSVKTWSASFLLNYKPKEAEKVLKKIADKGGLVAFSAEMTLKEWKAGNLKFDL